MAVFFNNLKSKTFDKIKDEADSNATFTGDSGNVGRVTDQTNYTYTPYTSTLPAYSGYELSYSIDGLNKDQQEQLDFQQMQNKQRNAHEYAGAGGGNIRSGAALKDLSDTSMAIEDNAYQNALQQEQNRVNSNFAKDYQTHQQEYENQMNWMKQNLANEIALQELSNKLREHHINKDVGLANAQARI